YPGQGGASLECLARAAELGHPQATFELAIASRQDNEKAYALIARAAELGYAEAQYRLGNYYRFGEGGLDQSFDRAAYWYERASLQQHGPALYALAIQTLLGQGVKQDLDGAQELVHQAAKLGMVDAMICFATMIDNSRGGASNPKLALYWFR